MPQVDEAPHILGIIADQLNKHSANYARGRLQDIRYDLKGLKRHPGNAIFRPRTTWKQ